jgi:NAD(P) transhydrogenase
MLDWMPEPEFDFDLVVIGSGPAGQRAAVQASKLGKRVCVIEKGRHIGGNCVDIGTIPSKTFREAVRSLTRRSLMLSLYSIGARPVRPTMQALLSRVNTVVERESLVVHDQFDRNEIELMHGTASFDGANRLAIEGADGVKHVSARFALIATGSRAIMPGDTQPDPDCVFTGDTILQAPRLPRTLLVIGAGVIGIEYASMFAHAGVQVTVMDKVDRPLGFLDHEIVDELVHQMRLAQVTFRLGEEVAGASKEKTQDGHTRVTVTTKSGKKLTAEMVLVSAGRTGNIEALKLETVGLQPDDRGRLKVDDRFRTTVPWIFAAGDVIGAPGLAATSYEQGRIAACEMFGEPHPGMSPHWPYGIYAVPELSCAGQSEEQLTKDCVPYEIGIARYSESARGQIRGDEAGLMKLVFHRETRKLLGVHCIGSQATELVHIGQAVMALGGGLDYFLSTVFNYPTFAECYKVAALNCLNRLRAVEAVAK